MVVIVMVRCEFKKLFSNRINRILVLVLVVIAVVFSFFSIWSINFVDKDGNIIGDLVMGANIEAYIQNLQKVLTDWKYEG